MPGNQPMPALLPNPKVPENKWQKCCCSQACIGQPTSTNYLESHQQQISTKGKKISMWEASPQITTCHHMLGSGDICMQEPAWSPWLQWLGEVPGRNLGAELKEKVYKEAKRKEKRNLWRKKSQEQKEAEVRDTNRSPEDQWSRAGSLGATARLCVGRWWGDCA
jgi:hypothetical protein